HTRWPRDWSSDVCSSDLCAVVFAGHIVVLGRVAPRHPVLPLVFVQLVGTGAMAAVAGPFVEPQHLTADLRTFAAIAYLAVFATRSEERRVGQDGKCGTPQ